MGTGVDADRGSAARAREPFAAPLLGWASALALIGMAAFTDIGMITRRRAGWPVRRVSMRSPITRQSPAYAPCDAFADVSAAAPAIARADTARRIRFITASFFSRKECQRLSARSSSGYHRNFKVPGNLRNRAPHREVDPVYSAGPPRRRGRPLTKLRAFICALYGACY